MIIIHRKGEREKNVKTLENTFVHWRSRKILRQLRKHPRTV